MAAGEEIVHKVPSSRWQQLGTQQTRGATFHTKKKNENKTDRGPVDGV